MVIGNGLRAALALLAGGGLLAAVELVLPPRGAPPGPAAPPVAVAALPAAPLAPVEAPDAPTFDAVRVEPDGTGLVAGRAAPGAAVEVLADGAPVAEAMADANGAFVAFLALPPSDAPREIRLLAGAPSSETVILAPTTPRPIQDLPAAGPPPDAAAPAARASPGLAADPVPATLARAEPLGSGAAPATRGPAPADAPAPAGASPGIVAEPPNLAPLAEAPLQPPVLLSDAGGVRVLAPAPEVLRTVALDAIAYGGAGEVALSGRATEAGAGGGLVRLYLDGALAAEAPVAPDGRWALALDAAPGLYALRVDQVGAAGEVTSRIELPFQREDRAEVAAILGAAPGAVAMRTVQPGHTLWAIARDRYDEPTLYLRVFEANRDRIRDPDLIYPGQVFVLPDMDGAPASP